MIFNKEIRSFDQLKRYADSIVLRIDADATEDMLLKAFFNALNRYEKRNVKKNDSQGYSGWLYYLTKNNRLGKVPNNKRNRTGDKLIKKGIIKRDKNGIYRATQMITRATCGVEGIYVKHRNVMDEISQGQWNYKNYNRLAEYLDGTLECTMTIDRDFETAYAPSYDEDFCLEGDLLTGTSCMSGRGKDAEQFYGQIDGCYVCRFENDKGEQVGRCIMYEFNGIRHFIRIYAKRDYARHALRLLKEEMHDNDLFGRDNEIEGMELPTSWDEDTTVMYLDGGSYGVDYRNGKFCVVDEDYIDDLKTTHDSSLEDVLAEADFRHCDHCGCWESDRNGVDINGDWYCCSDCAEAEGYFQCDECGEWHNEDDAIEIDGYRFCSVSCAESYGYCICRNCHKVIDEDDCLEIGRYHYCDEHCANEEGYHQCAYCHEWKRYYDLRPNTSDHGRLCCYPCAMKKGLIESYSKPRKKDEKK